jgi:Ca2+-binding RTX toxin-like protein
LPFQALGFDRLEAVGTLGDDQLFGSSGNDVLVGGAGNDILDGRGGNDTYIFAPGWGIDTITDPDPTGRLVFQGIEPNELAVENVNGNLVISHGADRITFNGYYTNGYDYDFDYVDAPPPPTDLPTLSVADPDPTRENEGPVVFTVTLSAPSTETVTVTYSTLFGTANPSGAQTDYNGVVDQTLTFAPGETVKTVPITLIDDAIPEPDETFQLLLETPTNATLANDRATATIIDDDAAATTFTITPANQSFAENAGTVTFTVSRSSTANAETVYVSTVQDQGSTNNGDYTGILNQRLDFAAGNAAPQTVTVTINDDTEANEPDETFRLIAQADPTDPTTTSLASTTFTIQDNDTAPPPGELPVVSVADASANESDGQIRFEISLDRPPAPDQPVTVNYRTVDTGSATGGPDNSPGNDYGDFAGVLEFTSTDPLTKLTAPISIFDDAVPEPDETFQLLLENPTNATLADDRATATIIDDDTSPPVDDILVRIERVGAEETPEGNTLSKEGHVEDVVDRLLSFRVSLLEPAPEDILIGWEVRPVDLGFGIDAADRYDFALDQLPSGQLSISKGTFGAFIDTIRLGGDWDFEQDEAFEVVVDSVPDGFAVDPNSGSATAIIGNDDQEFSTNGNILTEAALIAGFAYGSDPAAAITAGWVPIENAELRSLSGRSDGIQVTRPTAITHSALHAYHGEVDGLHTVMMGFRGTDEGFAELSTQVATWESYYQSHQAYIQTVLRWAADAGDRGETPVEQVIVAGHSLGGILAELYASGYFTSSTSGDITYNSLARNSYVITLGSPGSPGISQTGRLLNFVHTDDLVPRLDSPTFHREGTSISIEIPEGHVIGKTEHDIDLYVQSVQYLSDNYTPSYARSGHPLLNYWIDDAPRFYSIRSNGILDLTRDRIGDLVNFAGELVLDSVATGFRSPVTLLRQLGNLKVSGFDQGDVIIIGGIILNSNNVDIVSGSAVLNFDENLDGEYEFSIDLLGDFLINGFLVEASADLTTITYTGEAPNTDPIAVPDLFETAFETAAIIDVLANDDDTDGSLDPATVAVTGQGTKGTATVNPDGTITYTPNAGESGEDSFTYTVADDDGATSNEATVTVTIGDAPNLPPVASDDDAATRFLTSATISVLGNDRDPNGTLDPASVAVATGPANGIATANPDGTVTYTPGFLFKGVDSFTYTVDDDAGATSDPATITVTVGVELNVIGGTERGDFRFGTNGPDLIQTLGGNDTVFARGGDDVVLGGAGRDGLTGNAGNDLLMGGADNDTLAGGNGLDILVGGPGDDALLGGSGLDTAIFAGAFADHRVSGFGSFARTVQDLAGNGGRDSLLAVELLQFDDGVFDARNGKFTAGDFATPEVEALITSQGFSTDPAAPSTPSSPAVSRSQVEPLLAADISTNQVEQLVTTGEILV